MNIKQQREKVWRDEQGAAVPTTHIMPIEKLKEKYAFQLATQAIKINAQLSTFRENIAAKCEEIYNKVMTAKERKKATKGNFTWYNFDGSIKIEVSINDRIEFDSLLIEKSKQKLLELVGESISADKQFIKELVLSAFQTSGGELDKKKVLGLKKYAARITDKRYQEAMRLIDESIRRPSSKVYYRVWVRDESGKYEAIDLNFSNIS